LRKFAKFFMIEKALKERFTRIVPKSKRAKFVVGHIRLSRLSFLAVEAAFALFVAGTLPVQARAENIKMKPPGRETPIGAKADRALERYTEVLRVPVSLEQVRGIATDREDRIYVCGDLAIRVMDAKGNPIARIPLEQPARCLAYGGDGLLYVGMQEHVEVYEARGTNWSRKAVWAGLGEEAIVTSIAVVGEHVYAADAGNRMVMRYDTGGRLLGYIGKECETGEGHFLIRRPFFDVAAGKDGTIWIVNTGRYRVESFTREGIYEKSWGFFSESLEGFCGCCNPTHIALLSDGSIVTAEKEIVRVKVYTPDGTLSGVVAGDEQFEEKKIGLDLAVDSRDRILALDPAKRSVRVFRKAEGGKHE
jgi:hypothetical protein